MEIGKRPKPGRAKTGYIRVCCEIPIETNNVFNEYEKRTNKKLNKSKVMEKALTEEAEKLKTELEKMENK